MERKAHDPSHEQLLRIQKLFGVDSIDSFFGPAGATGRLVGIPDPAASDG